MECRFLNNAAVDSEYDCRNLGLGNASGVRSKRRGERGDGTFGNLQDNGRAFVRLSRTNPRRILFWVI